MSTALRHDVSIAASWPHKPGQQHKHRSSRDERLPICIIYEHAHAMKKHYAALSQPAYASERPMMLLPRQRASMPQAYLASRLIAGQALRDASFRAFSATTLTPVSSRHRHFDILSNVAAL